ncbi:Peroxisomal membrane protein PAS20 [Elasticomyces elasticus]|uniref:Peroxisomal membrane protein PAS20 n=1 Tax=Exophiala sideris TaxID=1016849 RepID=A0ABR0JLU9_9EURO|nr:Peroxisomal membrane protein PAS20 [Elasticomyces elasticus]KAK5036307.1 Peroxisomal membrane protein PAS20 [Exophiala sideris]KAK5041862.1 Peroxisomal membrane protein PAS20 [Exophiala sideris]KAK5066690.1 Peroxisomal membrane protein PAS20 [Exophiala sideris]KAK5184748.1 Peroxisomal membrane protein PAS20 [Eurotiomycetes sp. CCFEE 6388]
MAEIIGALASGITIAALFKTCLDTIDLIQTARHQELDLKKLVLKLKIEQVRLYAWGQVMGLTSPPDESHPRPLETCHDNIRKLARDILETIIQLFTDAQRLKDRYGCKELPPMQTLPGAQGPNLDEFAPIEKLTGSFSRLRVGTRISSKTEQYLLKTRWAIHDSRKFPALVAEVKDFVDALQNITQPSHNGPSQSETIVLHGIQRINDVETLDLVAETCASEHRVISDAASERSTSFSMTPERLEIIEDWTSGVIAEAGGENTRTDSLPTNDYIYTVPDPRSLWPESELCQHGLLFGLCPIPNCSSFQMEPRMSCEHGSQPL